MFDWSEVVAHGVTALGGAASVAGWNEMQAWRRNRGLGALLAGFDDSTRIVFPARENSADRPLGDIYLEDFLAIDNVNRAFRFSGRSPPGISDCTQIAQNQKLLRENNLILICSSKSNHVTDEALGLLRKRGEFFERHLPHFIADPDADGELLIACHNTYYRSSTYHQSISKWHDKAVIIKAPNPWTASAGKARQKERKILVIAGVRGIGTWGAAKMLRKHWTEIYHTKAVARSHGTTKQGDFAAILDVYYDNRNITEISLVHFENLDLRHSDLR